MVDGLFFNNNEAACRFPLLLEKGDGQALLAAVAEEAIVRIIVKEHF